ncbi:hypothetical protein ACI6Q2_21770 [Chitinophagaceae bacterium LWZ2-11]
MKIIIFLLSLFFNTIFCCAQFITANTQVIDSSVTNVPDSFNIKVKINLLNENYFLEIKCKKSPNDTAPIFDFNKSDKCFPESFYTTLTMDVLIDMNFPSYRTLYKSIKNTFYDDNVFWVDYVTYERNITKSQFKNFIIVTDINNDNIPEIILMNKEESGGKKPVSDLYRLDKQTKKIMKVSNFFNGAFYGWDNNYRYIITGWAEGSIFIERKNVARGLKLVPIEEIKYDGDRIISKKKWK